MQNQYEIYRKGHVSLMVREEDQNGVGRTTMEVDVDYTTRYGSKELFATVNWASHGSVSPSEAAEYAALITRAAELAKWLEEGDWGKIGQEATFAILGGGDQLIVKVN